ncbi:MAG: RNA polymerase sigma factor [Armatimonadota bacterium]
MPRTDDDLLVQRTLSGDTGAFEMLVDRYRTRVYNLAYRMVGDRDRADDLAQDAFIRAYRGLGTYRPGRKFSSWLFAIASNLCVDALRQRPFAAQSLDDPAGHPLPAEGRSDPQADYHRREMQQRLHGVMGRLPHAQRLATTLVHLQGMSYEEAAEVMGQPVGTVKSHAHRARGRLKQMLAPYMEEAAP